MNPNKFDSPSGQNDQNSEETIGDALENLPLNEKEIVTEKTEILSVEENAQKLLEQDDGREATDELKIDRIHLENMLDSARSLAGVLREREGEGLRQLIEEGKLSQFLSALREGEELLNKKEVSKEEFEDMIMKMTGAVENIGNAPSGRNVKDSLESLQKIISRTRRFRDDINEIGMSITKMEGRSEITISLIKRLENTLDEKQLFTKKLHGKLSEYLGGRY